MDGGAGADGSGDKLEQSEGVDEAYGPTIVATPSPGFVWHMTTVMW